MAIRIFVTGGTFDKNYGYLKGELYFKKTHVADMLKMGRCKVPIKITTLMMIDSLDMTSTQRKKIVKACEDAKEKMIMVTHGTDTMVETAKALSHIKGKTIVLTGAMIPAKFGSSDGYFNLGNGLAFTQSLPEGIYVVMNGRFFDYDKVRKNKKTGVFEEK